MEIQDTTVVCHPNLLKQRLGKETLAITGASRGGTSMVGFALIKLGYPLLSSGQRTHENDDILAAWDCEPERAKVIASNNTNHQRWGFKLPGAALESNWCAQHLRNPVFILVYRNPLAIGRSKIKRNAKHWGDSSASLGNAIEHGLEMMTAGTKLLQQDVPVVLVDFDAVKLQPLVFLKTLAQTFELTLPAATDLEAVSQAIAAPGYNIA